MKYNAIALAPVLAATAKASLLSLDADIKLPLGINVNANVDIGGGPRAPPPEDRTYVWHPPHHGVAIDDCDDDESEKWHWVHPGQKYPDQDQYIWSTETVTATSTHTVVGCPTDLVDCPAHHTFVTTVVVPETTTLCPVPAPPGYTAPAVPYYIPTITQASEQPAETSCAEEEYATQAPTTKPVAPPVTRVYEQTGPQGGYYTGPAFTQPTGQPGFQPGYAGSNGNGNNNNNGQSGAGYTAPAGYNYIQPGAGYTAPAGYAAPGSGSAWAVPPGAAGTPAAGTPGAGSPWSTGGTRPGSNYGAPAGTPGIACNGAKCPPTTPTTVNVIPVPSTATWGPAGTPTQVTAGAARNFGGVLAVVAAFVALF